MLHAHGLLGNAAGEEVLALQGPGSEVYSEGISRLREQIQSTQRCADVCLICLENIAPDAAVWTCQKSCHVLLHLICAQAWARQQLQSAAALARAAAEQPDLCAPLSHLKACRSASLEHSNTIDPCGIHELQNWGHPVT